MENIAKILNLKTDEDWRLFAEVWNELNDRPERPHSSCINLCDFFFWFKSKEMCKGCRNKHAYQFQYYNKYILQIEFCEEIAKTKDGFLLVRCTESKCRKWFKPTVIETRNRAQAILGQYSSGSESHFYCSDRCKQQCTIYRARAIPSKNYDSSKREVQAELRIMVFMRDNYECQRCGGNEGLECHHTEGVEQNPIESADMGICITLCQKCHKLAHKDKGCRYVDLQRKC